MKALPTWTLVAGLCSGCLHIRGDGSMRNANFPDSEEKSATLASKPARVGGYIQTLWPIQLAVGLVEEHDFAGDASDLGYGKVTSVKQGNDYLLGLRFAKSDFHKMNYTYVRFTHYRPSKSADEAAYFASSPDQGGTTKTYNMRKGWRFAMGYDWHGFGNFDDKDQSFFMGSYYGEIGFGYELLRRAGEVELEPVDFRRRFVEVSIGLSFSVFSWPIIKAILDESQRKK